ncbi:MAG: hypothetical protein J5I35_05050 [Methanothrix harundinacea]|nr:hypothetical protein [Methanothrix harundinacea]
MKTPPPVALLPECKRHHEGKRDRRSKTMVVVLQIQTSFYDDRRWPRSTNPRVRGRDNVSVQTSASV